VRRSGAVVRHRDQKGGEVLVLGDHAVHPGDRFLERGAVRVKLRQLLPHLCHEAIDLRWQLARIVEADVVLQRHGDGAASITPSVRRDGNVLRGEHREISIHQVDLERDRKGVTRGFANVYSSGEIDRCDLNPGDATELHMTFDAQVTVVVALHLNDVVRPRTCRIGGIVRMHRRRYRGERREDEQRGE